MGIKKPSVSDASPSEVEAELALLQMKSALLGRPGFLIRRLHQIHGYLFTQETSEFAITPVQYSVLTALSEQGQSDQVTISREVGLERTTVAEVLSRLQGRGLVVRTKSDEDQRVKLVKLTRKGRALLAQMAQAVERAHDLTIEPLSKRDQKQLLLLLGRLLEANNGVGNVPFRIGQ
jgi:DNA-binding MarR family transcriptional regulator